MTPTILEKNTCPKKHITSKLRCVGVTLTKDKVNISTTSITLGLNMNQHQRIPPDNFDEIYMAH